MNTFKSRYGGSDEESEPVTKTDYKFEEGQKRAIRNLEAQKFEAPEKWKLEVRIRYLDRRMLDSHNLPEPERLRLQDEWRKARDSGLSQ